MAEDLVGGTLGMMATEEVGTMKTVMTDVMISHGALEMITLRMVIGTMTGVPPPTPRTAPERPKLRKGIPPLARPRPVEQPL